MAARPPHRDALAPQARNRRPLFTVVDANLAALGYFSASSGRIRRLAFKTVHATRLVDGQRIASTATIVPSTAQGLPITADQDKFLALHALVTAPTAGSVVANPLAFTSADLFTTLGLVGHSGQHHRELVRWLDVMTATTIVSEHAVYLAHQRRWVRDRVHVFDRAVSAGAMLPDGRRADRHYVWLSAWQLENLRRQHVLPLDFAAYRRLRTYTARTLVPPIQVWLFAARRARQFQKRYDDVCGLLGTPVYRHRSRILEKLRPALDELVTERFLGGWQLEPLRRGPGFKLVMVPPPPSAVAAARTVEPRPVAPTITAHEPTDTPPQATPSSDGPSSGPSAAIEAHLRDARRRDAYEAYCRRAAEHAFDAWNAQVRATRLTHAANVLRAEYPAFVHLSPDVQQTLVRTAVLRELERTLPLEPWSTFAQRARAGEDL